MNSIPSVPSKFLPTQSYFFHAYFENTYFRRLFTGICVELSMFSKNSIIFIFYGKSNQKNRFEYISVSYHRSLTVLSLWKRQEKFECIGACLFIVLSEKHFGLKSIFHIIQKNYEIQLAIAKYPKLFRSYLALLFWESTRMQPPKRHGCRKLVYFRTSKNYTARPLEPWKLQYNMSAQRRNADYIV